MLASYQKPITVDHYIDDVIDAFVTFALLYQNGNDCLPLSTLYKKENITEKCMADIYAEVGEFCTKVREKTQQKFLPDQLGVDFYFARNGSATGFWDKPDIYGTWSYWLQFVAEDYDPFVFDETTDFKP